MIARNYTLIMIMIRLHTNPLRIMAIVILILTQSPHLQTIDVLVNTWLRIM